MDRAARAALLRALAPGRRPDPRLLVLDGDGVEVFRSEGAFAAGATVTWEPGLDTLWVVSEDAGTLFVQRGPHRWTATALTRATADLVPAEVRGLSGS